MSSLPQGPLARSLSHDIEAIRGNWFWLVLLGVGLIALGVIALGSPVISTIASAVALGSLILVSGVLDIVGSFWAKDWSGMLLVLLSGVLAVVIGFMLLANPVEGSLALTVLLASYLLVEGIFRVVAALWYRIGGWVWLALSGAIDVVLALLIWLGLPATGLTVIGVLLGISLIFRGVIWLMLGLGVRKIRPPSERVAPAA